MRTGRLTVAEYIKAKWRPYNAELGEPDGEYQEFFGKQTSVADAIAFQTNKGAVTSISSPLESLDSDDIQFDMYTTTNLPIKNRDEVEIDGHSYTVDSVIEIKDSVYAIQNFRTGKFKFAKVLRLK